ncbi:MarR family winged helix-turn-helix transcriptional regulator [Nioella aestuarii]|uniref:MarR family winged helix-turn-helix transcriptional regulator n=1 Tax=Nioella aestuarii TaxID=1662864 RepID=UPI003D7F36E4
MSSEDFIPTPGPLMDLGPRTRAILGVHMLFRKIEEQLEALSTEPALTKPERHLLVVLSQPTRMGALAQELQTVPSSITAIADSLEAKGLIGRQRDPDDRRAWRLFLTEDGQRLRHWMADRAAAIFTEATGLPDDDIDTLARLLAEVSEAPYRSIDCAGEI